MAKRVGKRETKKKLTQAEYRRQWERKYTRQNRKCGEYVRNLLQEQAAGHQEINDLRKAPIRTKEGYGLAVTDLLANIRHFCDMKGLDFGCLDNDAYKHYSAEAVRAETWVTQ